MASQTRPKCEVLVVGGGGAGFCAAIAAARNGADTLLVESLGFLGGMIGAAMNTLSYALYDAKGESMIYGGLVEEFYRRLRELGGASEFWSPARPSLSLACVTQDPYLYRYLALKMVDESGAKMLLYSTAIGVETDGSAVKGVKVANKSGEQFIPAEVVIDCTGDGDIAAWSGAPYEMGSVEENSLHSTSLYFRMGNVDTDAILSYWREHPEDFDPDSPPWWVGFDPARLVEVPSWALLPYGLSSITSPGVRDGRWPGRTNIALLPTMRKGELVIHASNILIDPTNIEDLTHASIAGHEQIIKMVDYLKENMPGFAQAHLIDIAPYLHIRPSRRIKGLYMLTGEDVRNGRKFEDSIALCNTGINLHVGFEPVHVWTDEPHGIPYLSLVPEGADGLLLAGKCISANLPASAALTEQPTSMATGEAAGVAAALCVQEKVSPAKLDVTKLQSRLKQQGVVL